MKPAADSFDMDKALGFITKRGCARTDAIAAHLAAPADEVDRLLQPAVDSGYLCACRVMRPGKPDAVEYRIAEAVSGAAKPMSFASFAITHRPKAATPPLAQTPAARRQVAPAASNPESAMSQLKVTKQQVLAAIFAAGKGGISRKTLIEQFGEKVDVHISVLNHQVPPVIFKPERGQICAIEFKDAAPARTVVTSATGTSMAATWQVAMHYLENRPVGTATMPAAVAEGIGCTEDSTRKVLLGLFAGMKIDRTELGDDFAYFVGEAPASATGDAGGREEINSATGVDATASHHDFAAVAHRSAAVGESGHLSTDPVQTALPSSELVTPSNQQQAEISSLLGLQRPAVVDDIFLNDEGETEFAIFSSGGLDIYSGETTVTMNKAVLSKLRRFLGLFQEAV